jgi:hypothetical protein
MSLSISDFIKPVPFIIAFSIGIVFVYLFTGRPEVIIKYPTPENSNELVFKDDVHNCYKFHTQEVPCPKNPLAVNVIPIQRKVETFENKMKDEDTLNEALKK